MFKSVFFISSGIFVASFLISILVTWGYIFTVPNYKPPEYNQVDFFTITLPFFIALLTGPLWFLSAMKNKLKTKSNLSI